jgi:hypothetical protein
MTGADGRDGSGEAGADEGETGDHADADGDHAGDVADAATGVLPPDELAGVVELFGALTPAELDRALAELAYRRGGGEASGDAARETREAAVADAVAAYYLVEVEVEVGPEDDGETERLLAPGPVAFPTLPAGAEDLPHLLDAPERDVDRATLAARVEGRLRSDAARAVVDGDAARMRRLLDVTYDLDTWGPADVEDVRRRLDDALAAVDAAGDVDPDADADAGAETSRGTGGDGAERERED